MKKIESRAFSPDGKYKYTYWVEGNEKNPVLFLIPGFTGTHGDLLEFAREFKDKFFIIIPDLPGWGDSPKGTYHPTIQGYAQFITDVADSLKVNAMYLAGHCMGSTVAIEFAFLYPHRVKQLLLIGVPYLEGTLSDNLFEHLAKKSRKVPALFRPFFFFFRSRIFAIPLGFFVIQTKSLKKKLSLIFHNSIRQQFQDEDVVEKNWSSLVTFDYNKVKKLTMPIHVFHGEKDMLVNPVQAKKFQELNTRITLDIVLGAGHMPPVETPKSLAHLVLQYL